jgi:hypothetical protein
MVFITSIFIFFIILIQFQEDIIKGVDTYFYNRGFSSRTLNKLILGVEEFADDTGRSSIRKDLIKEINTSPFWGFGAFGDSYLLDGVQAHNIFLSLWADFGYIMGSLILLYYLYMTIRSYHKYKNTSYLELILVFSFLIWPRAYISSGFWLSKELWILLALFIAQKRIHPKKDMVKNSLQSAG